MSLNQKRNRKIKLLNDQGGKCCYCGKPLSLDNTTLDHVIPKAIWVWNGVDNLVASCQPCNINFGSLPPKNKIMQLSQLAFS